jgi:hypothetical protein
VLVSGCWSSNKNLLHGVNYLVFHYIVGSKILHSSNFDYVVIKKYLTNKVQQVLLESLVIALLVKSPRHLWNPKVNSRVDKNSSLTHTSEISQFNTLHTFTFLSLD